jgi:hypothetical protein
MDRAARGRHRATTGRGRRLFPVAATTETQLELQGVIDALAVDRVIVVCLKAHPRWWLIASLIASPMPGQGRSR